MRRIFQIRKKKNAGAPPANTVAPVLSVVVVGQMFLVVTDGTWTGEPTSYAYAWHQDGEHVPAYGDQDGTVVVAGMAGHSLTCVMTATNAFGSSAPVTSNAIEIPA